MKIERSADGSATFVLNGTAFFARVFLTRPSRPECFSLGKPDWMIEEYIALAPEFTGARVVELGIAQGGSVAFFTELLSPSALLAVELAEEPNRVLADWIDARGHGATVRTAYGVDQADRATLARLADDTFGHQLIDLVVDDASHFFEPTVQSFEVLFPRVRPGGVLVLEDWCHAHTWERVARSDSVRFEAEIAALDAQPPEQWDLSRLVFALTLATAFAPELVSEVRVRDAFVLVRRGDAQPDPATFNIGQFYGSIGRAIFR